MTQKEKAKELIFKFYDIEKNDGYFDYPLFIFSQKCALIAVDEIINCDCYFKTLEDSKEFTKYWYEVQQEINKL